MSKIPEIGGYFNDEERLLIESFENERGPIRTHLTPQRKKEIESMARAAMNGERAKISLRVPLRDLTRLKSRALQEGIPYQTLINALIHRYVSD